MNLIRTSFFAVLLAVFWGFLGLPAHAVQVRCNIVHRTEVMAEIRRLETAKTTWESQSGSLNTLKLTLLQKVMTSGAIKNFDERLYSSHLLDLLLGRTQPTDSNIIVFVEGRLALLEYINLQNNKLLTSESFLKDIASSSLLAQRRVVKLLKDFDLRSGLTQRFLDVFSADLFLKTRGIPERPTDFLLKNASERVRNTWAKMFQEQLLERGLRRIVRELPTPELTVRERLAIRIKAFFHSQFANYFLSLPTALPIIKDVRLSEDLMVKVVLDGMPAHQAEIQAELASQGHRSNYSRLRQMWRPLFAGVMMYLTYPVVYNQMHQGVMKEVEVEIAAQRAQARQDAQQKVDLQTQVALYIETQSIQQKTNCYLAVTEMLSKQWNHRDWTAEEVKRVVEKAYGDLITEDIRTEVLNSLPERMDEKIVFSMAYQIEGKIFKAHNLISQNGELP